MQIEGCQLGRPWSIPLYHKKEIDVNYFVFLSNIAFVIYIMNYLFF